MKTISVCPKCQSTPHERDGSRFICVIQCDEDGSNAKGSECGISGEELKKLLSDEKT